MNKVGQFFKSFFVSEEPGVDPKLKKFWKKNGVQNFTASLLAIFLGLFISFFVILISAASSKSMPVSYVGDAFSVLIGGVFYQGRTLSGLQFGFNPQLFGNMLFRATPLIMTGLSVAVAFKAGLFNIGAAGQYVVGAMATLLIALSIPTSVVPAWIVWILAFLGGMLAGFVWGCIPGIFKATFGVNEVITCIMTNWIGLYIVNWVFNVDYKKGVEGALFVNLTEATKSNFVYKTVSNGVSNPTFGLDKIFEGSQVDGGIIIAIVIAIIVMILISKTTFGYELRATGYNRHASKYAGMKDKKNIILAMGISGALAAAGAALWYMSKFNEFNWTNDQNLPAEGFNGIPVSLLAYNNPIGAIFAAIFMAYINIGGEQLKGAFAINSYISDLIIAIIVYLSAFALMFKDIINGKGVIANMIKNIIDRKKKSEQVVCETGESGVTSVIEDVDDRLIQENTPEDDSLNSEKEDKE